MLFFNLGPSTFPKKERPCSKLYGHTHLRYPAEFDATALLLPDSRHMTYNLARLAFRKEVRFDPERGFDRTLQLQMCSRQLEALRETAGSRWTKLRSSKASSPGQAELKLFVKDLIRKCSESTDFYATVDFITKQAYEILEVQRGTRNRGLKKHLKHWDVLSHEHMVPGTVVFHTLIHSSCPRVFPILEPLSYRALVSGTKRKRKAIECTPADLRRVDKDYSSTVPSPDRITELNMYTLRTLPLKFWGILRYDAAGLLDELVPVSRRASVALRQYGRFKAAKYQNGKAFDTLESIESRTGYGV